MMLGDSVSHPDVMATAAMSEIAASKAGNVESGASQRAQSPDSVTCNYSKSFVLFA